jgi:hypothetical protein
MQECCPCGSVRGALGNRRPYRDTCPRDLSGVGVAAESCAGFHHYFVIRCADERGTPGDQEPASLLQLIGVKPPIGGPTLCSPAPRPRIKT